VEKLNVGGKLIGISRSHRYYKHKLPVKDWKTKQLIESTLRKHRSYGHKRLAKHLKINKKRVLRVMKIYGIKPYRRTAKKPFVYKKKESVIPNLLITEIPRCKGHIYASDFTYLKYKGKWIYVATVIDLYTREIVGLSILNTHTTQLVMNALSSAILHLPPPRIIHSDGGSEYTSQDYIRLLTSLKIQQSLSKAGCPWENGYQESFYKGFKIDLGDPNRFDSLGELIAEVYKTIDYYNKDRIHTSLGMPPREFAQKNIMNYDVSSLEKVS